MSQALVIEYTNTVKEFLAIAKSIAQGDLLKSPKAGEWSASFVIQHMADSEVHFSSRFMNALTETEPKIVPFNEDVYPERLNYGKRDAVKVLSLIEAQSQVTADLLTNVNPEDWHRKSIHPEAGVMTITDILAKAISHYQAHLNQLKEVKASL
jgi:hypothetical protein